MKNIKNIKILVSCILTFSFCSFLGAITSKKDNTIEVSAYNENYYKNVNTSSPLNLINSLKTITSTNFHTVGYSGLWTAYKTTDKRSDGKVNDYYSNITNYTFGTDQAGNYSKEGDKYNREHSIPKSWWGGGTDNQGCDPIVVVPSDGFVNGKRSNYPFGETNGESYKSANSFSKLGKSTFSGYSGTVFEPNDKYKGDFARVYFYAICRWDAYKFTQAEGNTCFSGSLSSPNYGLTTYAKNLLVKWHNQDPVDNWEKNRNDNIQSVQNNRNPFIDHPEWVNIIWGGDYPGAKTLVNLTTSGTPNKLVYAVGETFDPTGLSVIANYDDDTTEDVTKSVTWSPTTISASTTYVTGTYKDKTVTVNGISVKTLKDLSYSSTPNKTVYTAGQNFDPTGLHVTATYSDNSTKDVTNDVTWVPSPLIEGTTSVIGTYGGKTITVNGITVNKAENYILLESINDLQNNDNIIFACNNQSAIAGAFNKEYLSSVSASFSQDKKELTSIPDGAEIFTAKKETNGWKFLNDKQEYLGCTSAKKLAMNSGENIWALKQNGTNVEVSVYGKSNFGTLQYNSDSPRFNTYTSSQKPIQIYKLPSDTPTPYIPITGITLNKTSLTLNENETYQLTATISPDNATYKTVIWSLENSNIASIDQNGLVTAIKEGQTVVKASSLDESVSATCNLTVNKVIHHPESITLNKTNLLLNINEEFNLVATVLPDDAIDKSVSWSTTNSSIASIDNGKVKALKEGECDIVATTIDNQLSATCHVKVSSQIHHVTSISLNKTNTTLQIGQEDNLTYTITPSDATIQTVTWSSTNASIATITNGKIKAISKGECDITVTTDDNNLTATCHVKVIEPQQQKGCSGCNGSIISSSILVILFSSIGLYFLIKKKFKYNK